MEIDWIQIIGFIAILVFLLRFSKNMEEIREPIARVEGVVDGFMRAQQTEGYFYEVLSVVTNPERNLASILLVTGPSNPDRRYLSVAVSLDAARDLRDMLSKVTTGQ